MKVMDKISHYQLADCAVNLAMREVPADHVAKNLKPMAPTGKKSTAPAAIEICEPPTKSTRGRAGIIDECGRYTLLDSA